MRASGASSVEEEGDRIVVFDLSKLGTFGAAGKTIARGFIFVSGAGIGGEAAETDRVDLLDVRRDRVVDKDETEGEDRSVLLPVGFAVVGVLATLEARSEIAEADLAGEGSLGTGGMGRVGALRPGVCGEEAGVAFGVVFVEDLLVVVVRLATDGASEGALLTVDSVRSLGVVVLLADAAVFTGSADLPADAAALALACGTALDEV